ncbi:MAG: hypothetical protein HY537_08945 [Deltaproteobacteria bacterium]|nr:hypothetical protein [Deltaproteobacteria bacterium]
MKKWLWLLLFIATALVGYYVFVGKDKETSVKKQTTEETDKMPPAEEGPDIGSMPLESVEPENRNAPKNLTVPNPTGLPRQDHGQPPNPGAPPNYYSPPQYEYPDNYEPPPPPPRPEDYESVPIPPDDTMGGSPLPPNQPDPEDDY